MDQLPRDSKARTVGTLGALSAVGIAFVLAIVMGFLIGYGLDRWLGTSPIFLILFFFLGVIAGILNVVRTAARFVQERDGDRSGRGRPA